MYGMGGYGPMGGYGGGGPQFQNAVGQHLGNMMGGGAAHGMGNQMGYAPGGMPQPNPNYGQMPSPAPRPMPMPYPVDFSRLLGGGMSQYPGMGGGMSPGFYQPERTDMPMPGYGFNPQPDDGLKYGIMPISGPTYRLPDPGYGGRPMPMPGGGRVDNPYMQHQSRDGGLLYGGPPQPDTGAVDNPDQRHQFNNGDQYHNRKGNLRMRYRNMQPSYQ